MSQRESSQHGRDMNSRRPSQASHRQAASWTHKRVFSTRSSRLSVPPSQHHIATLSSASWSSTLSSIARTQRVTRSQISEPHPEARNRPHLPRSHSQSASRFASDTDILWDISTVQIVAVIVPVRARSRLPGGQIERVKSAQHIGTKKNYFKAKNVGSFDYSFDNLSTGTAQSSESLGSTLELGISIFIDSLKVLA